MEFTTLNIMCNHKCNHIVSQMNLLTLLKTNSMFYLQTQNLSLEPTEAAGVNFPITKQLPDITNIYLLYYFEI